MLISSVALGVAAGLVLGGRFARLGRLEIAWWPVLVAAIAVRFVAPMLGAAATILYVVGFAAIATVALTNRGLPGMWLIAAGAALNLVVVAANGGMPVDEGALVTAGATMPGDRLHVALEGATRLAPLADVIPLPIVRGVYSLGDVLLALGGFWLPFAWLRRP